MNWIENGNKIAKITEGVQHGSTPSVKIPKK
jgi:hypothetical protein